MTDKSATERLREMLDERGVEYETDDRNGLRETIWCGTAAFQLSPTAKMTMIVTPKQAIAATLGNSRAERTCHIVKNSRKYVLSDGRELFDDGCSICNGYVGDGDNYCSNCGARVVGE